MHAEARAYVKECSRLIVERRLMAEHVRAGYLIVIEYGSRDINGTIRDLFPNTRYIGVDISAGSGVDVIADAAIWKPPTLADIVVCCEVLEHTDRARRMVRNACRSIEIGGHVIITCATDPRAPHSAIDGGAIREGEFYENVEPAALRIWVDGIVNYEFAVADRMDGDRGDLYALIQRTV